MNSGHVGIMSLREFFFLYFPSSFECPSLLLCNERSDHVRKERERSRCEHDGMIVELDLCCLS